MDVQELRAGLERRERFAPDQDEIRAQLLARAGAAGSAGGSAPAGQSGRVPMRRRIIAALAVAAAVAVIAGGVALVKGEVGRPAMAGANSLQQDFVGIHWVLTSVQDAGRTVGPPYDGAYSLELQPDGSVVARELCNTATGRWRATSEGFQVVDSGVTAMGCGWVGSSPAPTDPVVLAGVQQVLVAPVTAQVGGDRLKLISGGFTLTYRSGSLPVPPRAGDSASAIPPASSRQNRPAVTAGSAASVGGSTAEAPSMGATGSVGTNRPGAKAGATAPTSHSGTVLQTLTPIQLGELRAAAGTIAKQGASHPYTLTAVMSTQRSYFRAVDAGAVASPADTPTVVGLLRGKFVLNNASRPPGAKAPTGDTLLFLWDPQTGHGTDLSLQNGMPAGLPDLAMLGSTVEIALE